MIKNRPTVEVVIPPPQFIHCFSFLATLNGVSILYVTLCRGCVCRYRCLCVCTYRCVSVCVFVCTRARFTTVADSKILKRGRRSGEFVGGVVVHAL